MYVECPTCHEDIEIVNIVHSPSSFYEPEDFDYGFAEEHSCQSNWDSETEEAFNQEVYDRYIQDDRDYEYDFYPGEE